MFNIWQFNFVFIELSLLEPQDNHRDGIVLKRSDETKKRSFFSVTSAQFSRSAVTSVEYEDSVGLYCAPTRP